MKSRDTILAAVRANKPAPCPLPDVPFFDDGPSDDLLGRFFSAFKAMGGTMLEMPADDPLRPVRERVAKASVVVSMVPEIAGNRVISSLSYHDPVGSSASHSTNEVAMGSGLSRSLSSGQPKAGPGGSPRNGGEAARGSEATEPASLADVDIAIVRAAFGIAETGSIALTERELGINTLAYLAQHLIVLLDPADIVINLHHAYQRPEFKTARYLVFHTGPSATADIEGVLIHGAQGVRSLSILPLAR